jgi:TonB family protein
MQKKVFLFIGLFLVFQIFKSQSNPYALEAIPVGGKIALEQVLQTQLTLPKTILSSNFDVDLFVYFKIDSVGGATDLKFEGQINNLLRKELSRILRLLTFTKTQNVYSDPYYLNFKLNTAKYNKYFKQQYKLNLKKNLPADSSYIVYSRADYAPEFYKNGEEGLKEFILSGMEYPRLAIEKSVEGTAVIEFIVETNGYLTGIHALKYVGAGCTEEALRMITQTRWQPATLAGKFVRYKMSYPITFSLRNISKENESSSRATGQ